MRHMVFLASLCLAVLSGPLHADEIFLTNGDRLTGKIVKLTEGKLVFESDLAGEVTVDLASVQSFSSAEPIEVHLKDGTVLNQKVRAAEPNQFAIEEGEALRPQKFQVDDVAAINPPPKPKPKWTGSISGAWTSTHGNTKAESLGASASAARRAENDRITASADYAKGKQRDPDTGQEKTTEDWWRAKAKYDYFFIEKFFGFLDGRYEKDSVALLDRRVVVGGGAGYQWIESEPMNFSTEVGLASLYEKFENATDSNSEMSLQAGYNFDRQLNDTVKFLHDLTYYPALEQFSDYYMTTTAELRASLTKTMFANFKAIFSYDETPAPGQGSTDTKYLFGVGLTF
jgi:putative salt-induced outer membrane protein YdiY